MSWNRRHTLRKVGRTSAGATSAPSVMTMPEPMPFPTPSTAATTASAGAVCASGSTARPTAIVSMDGTATHRRPNRSMTLPAG
ncbi:Uncharacterised protein [Mycobacteroides abscessus]|nr:Uncharacterised protein [Mycobacteroides abscessus]